MTSTTDAGKPLALDLAELSALLQDSSPTRIVVATDWSQAAVPFVVLQAWARALPPDAAAELVFTVPHEPGEQDLATIQVILEEIQVERDLAPITVESFRETVGQPFDLSVVPLGSEQVVLIEVADAIARMYEVAGDGVDFSDRNMGDVSALARRLSSFASGN